MRGQVRRAESAHRYLVIRGVQRDLDAQIRGMHHVDMAPRRADVARVLEGVHGWPISNSMVSISRRRSTARTCRSTFISQRAALSSQASSAALKSSRRDRAGRRRRAALTCCFLPQAASAASPLTASVRHILLQAVKRCLGDPSLSANLTDRRAILRLAKNECDLRLVEIRALRRNSLPQPQASKAENSRSLRSSFAEADQASSVLGAQPVQGSN